MNTVTVSKPIKVKGDFVLLPRKEYEVLVSSFNDEPDTLTTLQKRALMRARKNHKQGKTISLDELRRKWGIRR